MKANLEVVVYVFRHYVLRFWLVLAIHNIPDEYFIKQEAWYRKKSILAVDCIIFSCHWLLNKQANNLTNVYSTCFWSNCLHFRLIDRLVDWYFGCAYIWNLRSYFLKRLPKSTGFEIHFSRFFEKKLQQRTMNRYELQIINKVFNKSRDAFFALPWLEAATKINYEQSCIFFWKFDKRAICM